MEHASIETRAPGGVHATSLRPRLPDTFDAEYVSVHYQPQVSVRTGHITAVEAVIRYQLPDHGPIESYDLLRLAADAGVLDALIDRALADALGALSAWRRTNSGRHLLLSFDLDRVSLLENGWLPRLLDLLATAAVPASALEIEVAEHAVAALPDPGRIVGGLRACGMTVAIDRCRGDRVTMDMLRRLPITTLKIDPSLIDPIDATPDRGAGAAMLIERGEALGLGITADGVETVDQFAFLSARGCDRVQGCLIARPLEAAAFTRLLAGYSRITA